MRMITIGMASVICLHPEFLPSNLLDLPAILLPNRPSLQANRLSIVDDSEVEGDETFQMELRVLTGEGRITLPDPMTIVITDNDIPTLSDRSPPTGLSASSSHPDTIDLSWTNPVGADFSGVEVSWSAPGRTGQTAFALSDEVLSSGSLTAGMAASYRWVLENGGANGALTTVYVVAVYGTERSSPARVSITPRSSIFPERVTNLAAVPGDGVVTLSWTNSVGPFDQIHIHHYRSTAFVSTIATITDGSESYTVTGLTNGTAISFLVQPRLNGIDPPFSVNARDYITATPAAPAANAPNPPASLTATPGDEMVTLNWTNPTGSFDHIIVSWRLTSAAADTAQTVNVGAVSSYEVLNLSTGEAYRFEAYAVSAAVNSPTIGITHTLPRPSIRDLQVTASSRTSISLSWTNPTADFGSVELSWEPEGRTIRVLDGSQSRTVRGEFYGTQRFSVVTITNNNRSSPIYASVDVPYELDFNRPTYTADADRNDGIVQVSTVLLNQRLASLQGREDNDFAPLVDVRFTDAAGTTRGTDYEVLRGDSLTPLAVTDNTIRLALAAGYASLAIRALSPVRGNPKSITLELSRPEGETRYMIPPQNRTSAVILQGEVLPELQWRVTSTSVREDGISLSLVGRLQADQAPSRDIPLTVSVVNEGATPLMDYQFPPEGFPTVFPAGTREVGFRAYIREDGQFGDPAFEPLEDFVLTIEPTLLPERYYTVGARNSLRVRIRGEVELYLAEGQDSLLSVEEGESIEFALGVRYNDDSIPGEPLSVALEYSGAADRDDITLAYKGGDTISTTSNFYTITVPADGIVRLVLTALDDADGEESLNITLGSSDERSLSIPNVDIHDITGRPDATYSVRITPSVSTQGKFGFGFSPLTFTQGDSTYTFASGFPITVSHFGEENSQSSLSMTLSDPQGWVTGVMTTSYTLDNSGLYNLSSPAITTSLATGAGTFNVPLLTGALSTVSNISLTLRPVNECGADGVVTLTVDDPDAEPDRALMMTITADTTNCP